MSLAAWGVLLAVLVGHFSLHLAAYNRVNATGLRRRWIKSASKLLLINCLVLPVVAWFVIGDAIEGATATDLGSNAADSAPVTLTALPLGWRIYGGLCLAALPLLGIPWLLWRPLWGLETLATQRRSEVVRVADQLRQPLASSLKCRLAAKLPLNQIFELAIEEIELPVAGLPDRLDGYRIAHLSDLHFTGHVAPQWTAYAVQRANRWSPDLFALTGDLIDRAACIEWLESTVGLARASDGCYFVLGNHDTRIADPRSIRTAMSRIGWRDVGGQCLRVELRAAAGEECAPSVNSLVLGNERPWFGAPQSDSVLTQAADFRLLLSHSPDQLAWARRHRIELMLAGHTHGGQGRLPLAGPLLSPSWHGSRYASGTFYKTPTTMHVSRGLCGTHLMRINCRPELALLTLRVHPRT